MKRAAFIVGDKTQTSWAGMAIFNYPHFSLGDEGENKLVYRTRADFESDDKQQDDVSDNVYRSVSYQLGGECIVSSISHFYRTVKQFHSKLC